MAAKSYAPADHREDQRCGESVALSSVPHRPSGKSEERGRVSQCPSRSTERSLHGSGAGAAEPDHVTDESCRGGVGRRNGREVFGIA